MTSGKSGSASNERGHFLEMGRIFQSDPDISLKVPTGGPSGLFSATLLLLSSMAVGA
jgi:hypothetical protein